MSFVVNRCSLCLMLMLRNRKIDTFVRFCGVMCLEIRLRVGKGKRGMEKRGRGPLVFRLAFGLVCLSMILELECLLLIFSLDQMHAQLPNHHEPYLYYP